MSNVVTIRNIDDQLKRRLRVQAAEHGCSMEEEARNILRSVLSTAPQEGRSLVESIRTRVASFGGVDLDIAQREAMRPAPEFDE